MSKKSSALKALEEKRQKTRTPIKVDAIVTERPPLASRSPESVALSEEKEREEEEFMHSLVAPHNGIETDDSIKVVIAEFTDSLADGRQVTDHTVWYCLARESYDIAKKIYPDGFKQEDVIHIAQYIYWAVNPNWPLIPEFSEKKIDKKIINHMLIPIIIGNAYDAVENYIKIQELKTEETKDGDEKPWCKDCSLKEYCPCPPVMKPLCPNRIL